MKCERAEERILLEAEGELPPAEAASLKEHLRGCARCREFAAEAAALRASLEAASPPDPGDAFFAAARERIWREDRAQAERARQAGLRARFAAWLGEIALAFSFHRRELALAAAGVAAAVVLAVALWPRTGPVGPMPPQPEIALTPPSSASETDVWADVQMLSREDLQALATQLVIEAPETVATDPDEEVGGIQAEIEMLSPEELRAFERQLAEAAKEAKGA